MSLPTTNLTLHLDASDTDHLFKTWNSGGAHSGVPADGDEVQVWDDEGDGIADVAVAYVNPSPYAVYRTAVPLMLHPCLDFNGSSSIYVAYDQTGTTSRAISDFISASAFTILLAVYPEAITTTAANSWDNALVLGDEGDFFGLYTKSVGGAPKLLLYNWDGSEDVVTVDLPVGQTSIIMARHEGGNLYLSINGGTESSPVASGNTSNMSGRLKFGGDAAWYNGRIGEVAIWNSALSGADLSAAISYFMNKWLAAAYPNIHKTYGWARF